MFDLIIVLESLKNISASLGIFCLFWMANFSLSMYYNIDVLQESFDKDRMISGIKKLIMVGLGMLFLVLGITLLPQFMNHVGFIVDEQWVELFDRLGILSIIITSCLTYGKQSVTTLKDIFKSEQ